MEFEELLLVIEWIFKPKNSLLITALELNYNQLIQEILSCKEVEITLEIIKCSIIFNRNIYFEKILENFRGSHEQLWDLFNLAVELGHEDIVRIFVKHPDIQAYRDDDDDDTIYEKTLKYPKIVEILLQDGWYYSNLWFNTAVRDDYQETVKILIKYMTDIDYEIIYLLVQKNNLELIKLILAKDDPNIDSILITNKTDILSYILKFSNLETFKLFDQRMHSFDCLELPDIDTVMENYFDILEYILNLGIPEQIYNYYFNYLCEMGHGDVISFLCSREDYKIPSDSIELTIKEGRTNVLEILFTQYDLSVLDFDKLLVDACKYVQNESVYFLLPYVTIKDIASCDSPLGWSITNNNLHMVIALVEAGLDPSYDDNFFYKYSIYINATYIIEYLSEDTRVKQVENTI